MEVILDLALVLLLLAGFGVWLVLEDRRENGGVMFWARGRLLAIGKGAEGRVLEQNAHSPGWRGRIRVETVDLVIEFTPEGGAARRVPMRYRLPVGGFTRRVDRGDSVPLRYDPNDPSRVLIDWPSITG